MVAVASDAYKIRLVNVDTMATSKTKLGPAHGGPVTQMVVLPMHPPVQEEAVDGGAGRPGSADEGEGEAGDDGADGFSTAGGAPARAAEGYAAYSTYDKVIGLVRLPFDGNPSQGMGLIAHPGQVSSMAVTSDGAWVLTAGGPDMAIHMWAVNTAALAAAAADGGAGAAPFERLLDGGRDGPFYSQMADYFCYAQLRAQGEDSVEERQVPGRVPAAELPNLMRAVGFYPSDREIDEILQVQGLGGGGGMVLRGVARREGKHQTGGSSVCAGRRGEGC
jgi:hypothetical protein